MRYYGVEEFDKVCEWFYSGLETMVEMNRAKSRWFAVERSLRQGCHLSPAFV